MEQDQNNFQQHGSAAPPPCRSSTSPPPPRWRRHQTGHTRWRLPPATRGRITLVPPWWGQPCGAGCDECPVLASWTKTTTTWDPAQGVGQPGWQRPTLPNTLFLLPIHFIWKCTISLYHKYIMVLNICTVKPSLVLLINLFGSVYRYESMKVSKAKTIIWHCFSYSLFLHVIHFIYLIHTVQS